MCLIEYILTRVKKQKLTPSKNSSLWMKTLLKNIYKWNSCRGGDQPVSPYVHRTNKNVTVLKFWPEILCFEVAQRASIVFLNTSFILNSSAILLHKILNFEFSTLEPKNIVVETFHPSETRDNKLSDWFEASLYFNEWPIRRTWRNTGRPKLVHLMKRWTRGLGLKHFSHWLLAL